MSEQERDLSYLETRHKAHLFLRHEFILDSSTGSTLYGWKCSCGQVSAPWEKRLVEQQVRRHLREWSEAYALLAPVRTLEDIQVPCVTCGCPVFERVTLAQQGYVPVCGTCYLRP